MASRATSQGPKHVGPAKADDLAFAQSGFGGGAEHRLDAQAGRGAGERLELVAVEDLPLGLLL